MITTECSSCGHEYTAQPVDQHRVLCGDATDLSEVQRLMDGRLADMVFTDPPYNVDIAGGTHDPRDQKNYKRNGLVVYNKKRNFQDEARIVNDALSDEDFKAFLLSSFATMSEAVKPGAPLYVCHGHVHTAQFASTFEASGFHLAQILIWVKHQFVFGRQDYQWRHEALIYGWKEGAAHYFTDDKTQDTVWEIDRPMRSEKEHPTQKPAELVAKAINNSSYVGGLVLDLFAGAGSTLIAAEQTGRVAYLMEIEPAYCDVVVHRWEVLTGQKATRMVPVSA